MRKTLLPVILIFCFLFFTYVPAPFWKFSVLSIEISHKLICYLVNPFSVIAQLSVHLGFESKVIGYVLHMNEALQVREQDFLHSEPKI